MNCKCQAWERIDLNPSGYCPDHHPDCKHFRDSLIDVFKVQCNGSYYLTEESPKDLTGEETVVKMQIHREIYDRLPEFQGF